MEQTLLQGRPYTPSVATDIAKTFAGFGWIPPSVQRQQEASKSAEERVDHE